MKSKTSAAPYTAFKAFINKYVPQILEDNNSFSLTELNNQLVKFDILHSDYIDDLDESQLQQMRLDLIFLYHAIKLINQPIPDILDQSLQKVSALLKLPVMLLYEDLILFNPLFDENDARLFCTGKYRETELFFLKAHKNIEGLFEPLIETTYAILSNPYAKSFEINELLRKSIETYDAIIKSLSSLHLIPVEHFQLFRQYFYSTQKDSKGVSGRFSAQTFYFRILLDGQDISKVDLGYFTDIFSNAKYYPRKHLNKLISFTQERFLLLPEDKIFLAENKTEKEKFLKTIAELVSETGNKEQYQLLSELRQKVDKFTAVHFEMAHRFIIKPNKLQATDTFNGTGGEIDIEKYLESRINIHKKIGKLQACLN